ncbi:MULTISPECIES: hypothetical protein [unclassified Pseudomonas]|uniref:hypothetical protein n=1 Tax=unclassified Pseudomonas TaxID=196821 RepID=UPI0013148CDF|nr:MULTISPECIES: hypothetical protein [unclassified Pseudomonas]
MTALRRKTTIRGRPMKPLDLNVMCDICESLARPWQPRQMQQEAPGGHGRAARAGEQ